jgi:hypothetical protein
MDTRKLPGRGQTRDVKADLSLFLSLVIPCRVPGPMHQSQHNMHYRYAAAHDSDRCDEVGTSQSAFV